MLLILYNSEFFVFHSSRMNSGLPFLVLSLHLLFSHPSQLVRLFNTLTLKDVNIQYTKQNPHVYS